MIKIILLTIIILLITIGAIGMCILNKYKNEIWGSIEFKEE
jgi:hypothetical protein